MARLFHSLVVLGASVSASGCGGATTISSGGTPDESTGTGGKSNQGASGGASTGTGGRFGLGGASGSAGIIAGGGLGGALSTGGAGAIPPLPDAGTLAQWDCGFALNGTCAGNAGSLERFRLSETCPVDPTRPRSAAECGNDQWFQCRAALWMQQTPIEVGCECTPMLDAGCGICGPLFSDPSPAACSGHTKLCGCAFTGIAH